MRVQQAECERLPDALASNWTYSVKCYPPFTEDVESKDPFGGADGKAFRYTKLPWVEEVEFWGQLATYPGSGFIVDLNFSDPTQDPAKAIQSTLDRKFIDIQTRALILDLALYNPSNSLFLVMRLVWELPAAGGVIPTMSKKLVKLWRDLTVSDRSYVAMEVVMMVILAMYVLVDIVQIYRKRWSFFADPFNCTGALSNVILIIAMSLRSLNILRLSTIDVGSSAYVDLLRVATYQQQADFLMAFNGFFIITQLLRYAGRSDGMSLIYRAFTNSIPDMSVFVVVFFVFFFSFMVRSLLARLI